MKHFNIDGSFEYSSDPFPAFRSNLVFGRNKRDFEFLPTKAEVNNDGLLAEDEFKIIKTKAKGTLLVVSGRDISSRALVMCGVNDGFRGGSSIHKETTAAVLKECQARAACEGRIEIVALMGKGDQVVFRTWGRRTNDIIIVSFDGNDVASQRMTLAEFEALQENSAEYEDI